MQHQQIEYSKLWLFIYWWERTMDWHMQWFLRQRSRSTCGSRRQQQTDGVAPPAANMPMTSTSQHRDSWNTRNTSVSHCLLDTIHQHTAVPSHRWL